MSLAMGPKLLLSTSTAPTGTLGSWTAVGAGGQGRRLREWGGEVGTGDTPWEPPSNRFSGRHHGEEVKFRSGPYYLWEGGAGKNQ